MSYVALDQDIWTSTMLKEGPVVVSTWILLLASADRTGVTRATPSSIASVLRVPDEEIEEAYKILLSPDPKSRNQDEGGVRMVERGDGSYLLVSFAKYKHRASKINAARRQAEYEARLREAGDSPKRRKGPKEEDLGNAPGAPTKDQGRTHYVGDSCPGGHEDDGQRYVTSAGSAKAAILRGDVDDLLEKVEKAGSTEEQKAAAAKEVDALVESAKPKAYEREGQFSGAEEVEKLFGGEGE